MHVKYIAQVKGAREVTLIGSSAYKYWAQALARERLVPVATGNRAAVRLSGVELTWMGIRFRELSISIAVHEVEQPERTGVYLAAAFNTSKLFSFIERKWFHTPYCHAEVNVSTQNPWSFQLDDGGDTLLRAVRHASAALNEAESLWEGSIYLPSHDSRRPNRPELFFARLHGPTQIAAFDATRDEFCLAASKTHPILQSLIDSRFTGVEWRVRSNATHARSKTYKRGSVP
jgi:hypothetical protein